MRVSYECQGYVSYDHQGYVSKRHGSMDVANCSWALQGPTLLTLGCAAAGKLAKIDDHVHFPSELDVAQFCDTTDSSIAAGIK